MFFESMKISHPHFSEGFAFLRGPPGCNTMEAEWPGDVRCFFLEIVAGKCWKT